MPLMAKKKFLAEILSNIILLHNLFLSDAYIYSLDIALSINLRISKKRLMLQNIGVGSMQSKWV